MWLANQRSPSKWLPSWRSVQRPADLEITPLWSDIAQWYLIDTCPRLVTTLPHRCFFPSLRYPFFFFLFFYLTPNMFKVHHSNNSRRKIKPIICRGWKQRDTCSFLDIQRFFFVFFSIMQGCCGKKTKTWKELFHGSFRICKSLPLLEAAGWPLSSGRCGWV